MSRAENTNLGDAKTIGNLCHAGEGCGRPLPDWALFFLEVGRSAISVPRPDQRLVVSAVVPTREFAAAFVALGAVEERTRRTTAAPNEDHFAELAALTKGDKVTVFSAGKKYVASFERASEVHASEGIYVVHEKDGLNHFLPKKECDRVAVGALGKERLPTVGIPRDRRSPTWDAGFIEAGLGITNADEFVRRDDFTALIIGPIHSLRFELEDAVLGAMSPRGELLQGHIEDLIRTKKFADDVEGEPFRTEVMSDRARQLDPALKALQPPVVILDGGRGFLKHQHDWRRESWVIILDRSSAVTDEAAKVLNTSYVEDRIDDTDPLSGMQVPAGVEVSSFLAMASR